MDKQQLIDRLKRLVDYAEAMPMDSVMENFTVKELKDWIRLLEQEQKEHQNYCKSCNEPMSNDCKRCEKLWSS